VKIRIGTRGSRLARVQAESVARDLANRGHAPEIVEIRTAGDRHADRPFSRIGAPGVFVRDIEIALVEGRIDVAVHSYKDLPGTGPDDLVVAAVPGRLDPTDRLVARPEAADPDASGIQLRPGARVGTASARRQSLLTHLRPDLEIALLRGNLPTRIQRLREGRFDAVVLASAGLVRLDQAADAGRCPPLGRSGLVETNLDPTTFVPAATQGALALQVRRDRDDMGAVVRELDDPEAHRCVRVERALLKRVEGGCQVPFGAWCCSAGPEEMEMTAVLEKDGILVRAAGRGRDSDALVNDIWTRLRGGGGS